MSKRSVNWGKDPVRRRQKKEVSRPEEGIGGIRHRSSGRGQDRDISRFKGDALANIESKMGAQRKGQRGWS